MPKLGYTFDANATPEREFVPGAGFDPLPDGRYRLMATSSDVKPTKKAKQLPDGSYDAEQLTYECDVQSPAELQGRKVFLRFNIKNPNPQAEDIAHRELGELSRACGKGSIQESEELHNILFDADLIVLPSKPYKDAAGNDKPGSPQNAVKAYSASSGAAPTAKPATTAAQPAATGTTPPWKRK